MGDVAMMLPALLCLKMQYNVTVTVVSRPMFAPIFKDTGINFFPVDLTNRHNGLIGIYKLYKDLRRLNISAVADLHQVIRSKILGTLFLLTGIPVSSINKGRKEKKALTRLSNKVYKPLKHTVLRYAEVFSKLGFDLDLEHFNPVPQNSSEEVTNVYGPKIEKWLGIAPFAQHSGKVYPIDLMQEVVNELSKMPCKLFLLGGNNEKVLLKQLTNQLPNAIVVAGNLTFEQELTLIAALDVMLSMDSANGHLAANFGVPVVTLWGATHPYAGFAPYGQPTANSLMPDLSKFPALPTSVYGNKMIPGYEDVMRTIPPSEVVQKVWQIANQTSS